MVRLNKKITLACAICSSRNYSTTKNVSTQAVRLEVQKYCKTCGKHTLHRETK
ncbi:50S ribosomal protein L33 [Virgibacillus doumboii]|uniref:50S ribosomal protein L33 n=1 Tax=Virgibacillus doumboii TaxID=2697503 RepID=UPI003CCD08E9